MLTPILWGPFGSNTNVGNPAHSWIIKCPRAYLTNLPSIINQFLPIDYQDRLLLPLSKDRADKCQWSLNRKLLTDMITKLSANLQQLYFLEVLLTVKIQCHCQKQGYIQKCLSCIFTKPKFICYLIIDDISVHFRCKYDCFYLVGILMSTRGFGITRNVVVWKMEVNWVLRNEGINKYLFQARMDCLVSGNQIKLSGTRPFYVPYPYKQSAMSWWLYRDYLNIFCKHWFWFDCNCNIG